MTGPDEVALRFPSADGSGEVSGIAHRPAGTRLGGLVVTHGRSSDMRNRLVTRVAGAAADAGLLALRMNFRYVEERTVASRDLSREEGDLRGAIRFLRGEMSARPIFIAGASMGARVCARASSDPDAAGVIALGYPLHPRFRPEVRNPPEWPFLVKPTLFVQGDRDPFCDLGRLREDLTTLAAPHELVVIPNAGHSFEPRGAKRDTFLEIWDAVLRWITPGVRADGPSQR
ncbi:MAG TPA: alpha/beta family hydrolase [Thermoplasmata archaeon]|nr:alpha/beta family hydrolase [Thermoplasmata archaeon]